MRKGFIFILVLFFNSPQVQSKDFFIIERDDGIRNIWNIRDAKEISIMQYEVQRVQRPSRDKILYNNIIIKELFNFCEKPEGKYKSTNKMLYLGNINREDRGIEVYVPPFGDRGKSVKYWTPFFKFLNSWEYKINKDLPDFDITCRYKIKGTSKYRSKDWMINWWINLRNKDTEIIDYFDCDRIMYDRSYFGTRSKRKISWKIMRKGSRGENYIKENCKYLMRKK